MTPQQAYEQRYANIDNGRHAWDAAPPHVKDMWLAAWTIAWAMAEHDEREACAMLAYAYPAPDAGGSWRESIAAAIRARGQA